MLRPYSAQAPTVFFRVPESLLEKNLSNLIRLCALMPAFYDRRRRHMPHEIIRLFGLL